MHASVRPSIHTDVCAPSSHQHLCSQSQNQSSNPTRTPNQVFYAPWKAPKPSEERTRQGVGMWATEKRADGSVRWVWCGPEGKAGAEGEKSVDAYGEPRMAEGACHEVNLEQERLAQEKEKAEQEAEANKEKVAEEEKEVEEERKEVEEEKAAEAEVAREVQAGESVRQSPQSFVHYAASDTQHADAVVCVCGVCVCVCVCVCLHMPLCAKQRANYRIYMSYVSSYVP